MSPGENDRHARKCYHNTTNRDCNRWYRLHKAHTYTSLTRTPHSLTHLRAHFCGGSVGEVAGDVRTVDRAVVAEAEHSVEADGRVAHPTHRCKPKVPHGRHTASQLATTKKVAAQTAVGKDVAANLVVSLHEKWCLYVRSAFMCERAIV